MRYKSKRRGMPKSTKRGLRKQKRKNRRVGNYGVARGGIRL